MESKDVPDWYAVLGIKPDATKEQIRTAFKKRTIETHPDRHGNDPKKKDLFLSVRKAWEILSDEKAKAAFDAILKVRAARLVKDREMDSKRKSMKDDLIAREQAYKKQKTEVWWLHRLVPSSLLSFPVIRLIYQLPEPNPSSFRIGGSCQG